MEELDIENMRARELRKLLIDKFGVSASNLSKIIDRKKLKELAEYYVSGIKEQKLQEYRWEMGKVIVTALLGLVVLWQVRKYWSGFFSETIYSYKQRFGMLRASWKNRLVLPMLALCIVIVLDTYCHLIQLQILLSWASIFGIRLVWFRLPTISLPVSPSQMIGRKVQQSGVLGTAINSGLDIGPMVTLWLVSYVRSRLQEYSAGALLHIAHAKEARREARRQARQQRDDVNNINNATMDSLLS